MRILQQMLAAVSDETPVNADEDAKKMLKGIMSEIKLNKTSRKDGMLVHEIRASEYLFPKQFSIEKIKTRWEEFAETKGIKKRKRGHRTYSEELGKWMPRWGSESVQNMKIRSGVLEVKQSISKLKKEKKARVAKNIKNMLANRKRLSR